MRLLVIFVLTACNCVFALENLSDEDFAKEMDAFQKSDKFAAVPASLRASFLSGIVRTHDAKRVLRGFIESLGEERNKWASKAALDSFRGKGPLEVVSDSWNSEPGKLPDGATQEQVIKAVLEATSFRSCIVLRDKATGEVERYVFRIEAADDKPVVSSVVKDTTFDAHKFLLERQDLAISEFLRGVVAKPREVRSKEHAGLASILTAEKCFLHGASNVKGELATTERAASYAVAIDMDTPAGNRPAAVFLVVEIRKTDGSWAISEVTENKQEQEVFQKNIVIAAFVKRFLEASPEERASMRAEGIKSDLPEKGKLTMYANRPGPFDVKSAGNLRWEVPVLLTHSEKFGPSIGRNSLWFDFWVSQDDKGELKICKEQMRL